MSKAASVFFTGMDSSDAEQLITLFHDVNRRTGNRWTLASDADSATMLVIDVDTLYGHMTWLRAHSSEQTVVALTAGTSAEADHVLQRPVAPDAMRRLMLELAGAPASALAPVSASTPPPAAPERAIAPTPPASTEPVATRPVAATPPRPTPTPTPPAPIAPVAVAAAPTKTAARKLIDLILAGEIPAGAHKLELPGHPPLVLDLAQKVFLCGNSIKAFLPYTQTPLTEDTFKRVSSSQYEALQQGIGGTQPLGRLVWLAALGGSGGEIPDGAADARYRLTKWPQIEREFPKHFRIATTMMKGFQTSMELADQSGATLAEVNDFIAASLVSGYAESEQPNTAPTDTATTPAQKSLLERLRGAR